MILIRELFDLSLSSFINLKGLRLTLLISVLAGPSGLPAQTTAAAADFVIKNATVMTASHGTIERANSSRPASSTRTPTPRSAMM